MPVLGESVVTSTDGPKCASSYLELHDFSMASTPYLVLLNLILDKDKWKLEVTNQILV